jgi:hypothetical protein
MDAPPALAALSMPAYRVPVIFCSLDHQLSVRLPLVAQEQPYDFSQETLPRVYIDRIARGYRDHRNSDRIAAPGGPTGKGGGPPINLPEQFEAARNCVAQLPRSSWNFSALQCQSARADE